MRKLTKRQKAKNKVAYKNIRKEYEKVKDKSPVPMTYKQFKARVVSRSKSDNISLKDAAKKEARTETFWSPAERSRENLLSGIKEKHSEAYGRITKLSRNEKGRFTSVKDNLKWDKDRGGYVLKSGNKSYFINVTNSPEEVNIEEIL